MLTVNAIYRLVVLAKKHGKGKLSNGDILTKLIGTLIDTDDSEKLIRYSLVLSVDDPIKLNRYTDKLMQNRVPYPFLENALGTSMEQFQALVRSDEPNYRDYLRYIRRMSVLCQSALDPALVPAMVHTLLSILQADDYVHEIYYNCRMIPKEHLIGNAAHRKSICVEALLLGLWYHVHAAHAVGNARELSLLEMPESPSFSAFLLEERSPDVYTQSKAYLDRLLDLDTSVPLSEQLREVMPEIQDTEGLYPLELCYHQQVYPALELLSLTQSPLFLMADGAMGKTTLLRSQKGFYLPLNTYKKEIREHLLPDVSCWILVHILLKYRYGNAYGTLESCIACEGENTVLRDLSALYELLCRSLKTPQFVLLLDGTNEIPSELTEAFADELAYCMKHWHNVRIIVAGRTVPDYPVYAGYDQMQLLGIPVSVRDKALSALPSIPSDITMLELLRSPLFLRLFLSSRGEGLFTRGEILDAYFKDWKSPISDNSKLLLFAVQFLLPFAANAMLHHHQELTRADLSDAMKSASELFLDEERIYQNCIAPLHFHKTDLLHALENTDIVSLVIDHTGLLVSDAYGQLRFSHQYYRDYFAAKYILNLIEALVKGFGDNHPEEQQRLFNKYGLGGIWFWGDDSDEIYRLIGEICGDAKNIPDETGLYYQETLLDDLLDMARQFPHFRMTENVMHVMHLCRNGLVCGVDFNGLNLPFTMPEGRYFSDHGLYPCNFRNAKVLGVFASSIPEDGDASQTVYPSEECEKYYLNCDFFGAVYLDEDNREILCRYGAIV